MAFINKTLGKVILLPNWPKSTAVDIFRLCIQRKATSFIPAKYWGALCSGHQKRFVLLISYIIIDHHHHRPSWAALTLSHPGRNCFILYSCQPHTRHHHHWHQSFILYSCQPHTQHHHRHNCHQSFILFSAYPASPSLSVASKYNTLLFIPGSISIKGSYSNLYTRHRHHHQPLWY